MSNTNPTDQARRSRRHREGLARQLEAIREEIAELRADVAQLAERQQPVQEQCR